MAGNDQIRRGRAKVANPFLFEERNATLQYLKKWFNVLGNHQRQNDEFLVFFEGEDHENWVAKSENVHRGIIVHPRQAVAAVQADPANNIVEVVGVPEITVDQAAARSRILRRDLETLLNNYATYAPEAFYETIINDATSVQWIFDRLALYCKLSSDKQFILNSHQITFNKAGGDTPEKLFLRLRSHYAQAAPKEGSRFDGTDINEDVKVNELCDLMLVEMTLHKIDPRLPGHIQSTRAHLMQDGKTLFCVRRILWDQVDLMIRELDEKEDLSATVNFAQSYTNRFRSGSNAPFKNRNKVTFSPTNRTTSQNPGKPKDKLRLCGACFRASEPESVYSSHNITSCRKLSREEKSKMFKAAARMLATKEEEDDETISDLTGLEENDNTDSESS